MLVLDRGQVEALLDLDVLIDALAVAMVDLSRGVASVPDRVAAVVADRDGLLAAMPGFVPSAAVLMAKLVSLFPRNAGTGLPTHQAVIVGFDRDTGEPVAVLDGTAITAIRTGACSALSARLLARPDAAVLAVLGTGVQARSHARAMCRVRPIREIRIAGRDPAKATALATELADDLGVEVVAVASYPEALNGATVACATTHAIDPVVRREWLTPGGAYHLGRIQPGRPRSRRRDYRRGVDLRGIPPGRVGPVPGGQQRSARTDQPWGHHRCRCARRTR
jgi:alanine dehydrogenase